MTVKMKLVVSLFLLHWLMETCASVSDCVCGCTLLEQQLTEINGCHPLDVKYVYQTSCVGCCQSFSHVFPCLEEYPQTVFKSGHSCVPTSLVSGIITLECPDGAVQEFYYVRIMECGCLTSDEGKAVKVEEKPGQ